jgi:hypothetical protein
MAVNRAVLAAAVAVALMLAVAGLVIVAIALFYINDYIVLVIRGVIGAALAIIGAVFSYWLTIVSKS